MNATDTSRVLKIKPGLEYVFLLDDLELAMTKEQLDRVTKAWNSGTKLEVIADEESRNPIEVLLALIHQAREKNITRPFAGRL